jgi:hypothetical protein
VGEKIQQAAAEVKRTVEETITAAPKPDSLGQKVSHIAERAAETAQEEAKRQADDMMT